MKRVATALILFPIVIYLVLWANFWAFAAALAVIACICYYEYDSIAARYDFGAPGPIGYAAGLMLLALTREPWLLITGLVLVALTMAMRAEDLAKSLPRAALLVIGVVYVFGCWKCALLVREVNKHWLLYALLVNWAGDIGAYYVGRTIGRHKLAARVSPHKTWEGSAGSLAAAVLIAGAYAVRFIAVPIPQAVGLTLAANAAGQLGDLAESAMKRGADVKDSGTILPGHGGFLDRVDSTLFALPVIYAYLQFAR